jgi:hypothetical protein
LYINTAPQQENTMCIPHLYIKEKTHKPNIGSPKKMWSPKNRGFITIPNGRDKVLGHTLFLEKTNIIQLASFIPFNPHEYPPMIVTWQWKILQL